MYPKVFSRDVIFQIFDPPEADPHTVAPICSPVLCFVIFDPPEADPNIIVRAVVFLINFQSKSVHNHVQID